MSLSSPFPGRYVDVSVWVCEIPWNPSPCSAPERGNGPLRLCAVSGIQWSGRVWPNSLCRETFSAAGFSAVWGPSLTLEHSPSPWHVAHMFRTNTNYRREMVISQSYFSPSNLNRISAAKEKALLWPPGLLPAKFQRPAARHRLKKVTEILYNGKC